MDQIPYSEGLRHCFFKAVGGSGWRWGGQVRLFEQFSDSINVNRKSIDRLTVDTHPCDMAVREGAPAR